MVSDPPALPTPFLTAPFLTTPFLTTAFLAALDRTDLDGVAAARAARDLLDRWAEPHRRYHTVAHLEAVLAAIEELLEPPDPPRVPDPDAVRLAAWFHDAVYRGVPGEDERASALLAERVLGELGQPPGRVAEVARLVRMTAGHAPQADDPAGEVLADADLAVLASDAPGYREYARAIRQEYAHLPDPVFRAGRAQVLRRLTAGERVYRTARGRARWESSARANVAAELAGLTGPRAEPTGQDPEAGQSPCRAGQPPTADS